MHRETVKFQAIEKKSHVADQEINELLSKNDELTERTKDLTNQIADLEKRREDDSQAVAREKEQWGRMLDMSSRLQTKAQEDRRQLQEDVAQLHERIKQYDKGFQPERHQQPSSIITATSASTRDEVEQCKAQIQQLRKILEDVQRHHLDIASQTSAVQKQQQSLADSIGGALGKQNEGQAASGSAM